MVERVPTTVPTVEFSATIVAEIVMLVGGDGTAATVKVAEGPLASRPPTVSVMPEPVGTMLTT